MGDNTFARCYGDNVTGDSHFEAVDRDDTADSLEPRGVDDAHAAPAVDTATEPEEAEAAPPEQEEVAAAGEATAGGGGGGIPDWTAPAFLPPYLQAAPSHHSDHPALAHSPDVTNSSLGTLDTRRVSVDARRASMADPRRGSRRCSTATSMQDATGRLLADDVEEPLGQGGDAPQSHQSAGRRLSRRRSSGISREGA